MHKRTSKQDENVAAYSAVRALTSPSAPRAARAKNPAAVALGRLGGLKGGKARAASLSPSARRDIARKAAQARWKS